MCIICGYDAENPTQCKMNSGSSCSLIVGFTTSPPTECFACSTRQAPTGYYCTNKLNSFEESVDAGVPNCTPGGSTGCIAGCADYSTDSTGYNYTYSQPDLEECNSGE